MQLMLIPVWYMGGEGCCGLLQLYGLIAMDFCNNVLPNLLQAMNRFVMKICATKMLYEESNYMDSLPSI